MKRAYWLAPLGVALAAGLFSWLNRGERVIVHMGITTFYRAPLTLVLFLAFLAGMLAMMALTLRQDLRVREALRARGLLDGHPGPVPENAPRAPHALVDPYENGASAPAPHLEATPSHPPFSGDGAAYRHDYPATTGDADATQSHPPFADGTGYRFDHPTRGVDGDATHSHPPLADGTGYGPDHPKQVVDGDVTHSHPPLAGGMSYHPDHSTRVVDGDASHSHLPLAGGTGYRSHHPAATGDGDVTQSHPPLAGDRMAYRRDGAAASDDGNATFIHRREGEPPTT